MRLVRATAEGDRDTFVYDAEGDEVEPMDADASVGSPMDEFSD